MQNSFNWVDCRSVAERNGTTFNFFIGGRGTGKTYGVLTKQRDDIRAGKDARYMYMRLSQTELDGCATELDNPYKRINIKLGTKIGLDSVPKSTAYIIKDKTDEEGELILGVARSLSSFHNLRGADFSDIKEIYFDEFIPTETLRKTPEIKHAGYLFNQAYETINRNRELEGEPPVRVYFTANAFSLDSNILAEFGLIEVIEHMQRIGQKKWTDREASIYVELIDRPDIAEAKKQTALYKAQARNKKLLAINIENKFADAALALTNKNVKLIEYAPIFTFNDELTLFSHKSTGAWHIVGRGYQGVKESYRREMREKMLLKWGAAVRIAMKDRAITFDSVNTYYLTERVFDKTLKVY